MNLDKIKNIHFIGIGGIGMSGIAEILKGRGMTVSGCDLKRSSATSLLAARGVDVHIGHDPAHLAAVDAVVVTAAVKGANVEVDAARERGIEIIRRKDLLAAIVNEKRGVGVSGTHGKTTTSAMIATVLEDAGLDPTIIIGGILQNIASNAKDGKGDVVVVEADEYDRTFHEMRPEIAVITNIEADHLEYYGSFENIVEAFRIFTENVRPGGAIIGCVDDPAVAALLDRRGRGKDPKIIRYGLGPGADLTARDLTFHERGSSFEVEGIGFFKLFVPGEHNVRNALAAIAVARELGVSAEATSAVSPSSSASIGGFRSSATTTARWLSTTTRITRPRSRPRSMPRGAVIRGGASSPSFSRISTRAHATSRASSASHCAARTLRSSRRSMRRARNRSRASHRG